MRMVRVMAFAFFGFTNMMLERTDYAARGGMESYFGCDAGPAEVVIVSPSELERKP
jgi:hypothetical protein